MQTLFLFLAVVLITVLAIKGIPIFYGAIITSIFVLATAGITDVYASSFANFVKGNLFIFAFGAIFGKILEMSGAANSIADYIVKKIGSKAIVPAIIIAGGIMGYGGISVFVGIFALYPLMFEMFKRANISRTLAPGIYCAAAGSFSVWMPGSPSIQLLTPVQALGTSTFAAAVPGFIVGFIQILLEIIFCVWFVKYTQKKGLGWEGDEGLDLDAKSGADRKYPNFFVALIPMIVLIGILGFAKLNPAIGLFIGILTALVVYIPYLPWKSGFWAQMQTGFIGGGNALITTCSVVGFGAVVQSTDAFQNMINVVVGLGTNPLITSVAVTAVLAGVCGSGTGGLGMSLPIIQEYFVPMGVNLQALTRGLALSSMIFTLPSNSVVNTAISAAKSTHKQSYFMVFITVSVMSLISMILLLLLFAIMGTL